MISELASPTVCVIDNEKDDYEPILQALNGLFISAVHIVGTMDSVPAQPFKRLRLIFVDLHLTAATGKDAASHTANIFMRTVSTETAPIVAVIWSKYAKDKVAEDNIPPDDQDTEAEVFKKTLLGAEPKFKNRLIFVEMAKPMLGDRPAREVWTEHLKTEVATALQNHEAVEALWGWESLVADSCSEVTADLTSIAEVAISGTQQSLKDGLKATLQKLAMTQGEGDFSQQTAPGHLLAVLSGLLIDELEQPDGVARVNQHGPWLHQNPGAVGPGFASQMNSVLMASGPSGTTTPFIPGTIFQISDANEFGKAFGATLPSLVDICCKNLANKGDEWRAAVRPVLIELSPVCDMAQGTRVSALLTGGVIVPSSLKKIVYDKDAFGTLSGVFRMRWPIAGFPEQDVVLAFCHRYRMTLPAANLPAWLQPWFRLRELPTASIRNRGAAYAARVGYVSMQ